MHNHETKEVANFHIDDDNHLKEGVFETKSNVTSSQTP
jgi:hypothetical protein